MDWKEMYEAKDTQGDEVLDVWFKDDKPIAYQYRQRRNGNASPIVAASSSPEQLIKKKRYSFVEAVEMMKSGKRMRVLPERHAYAIVGNDIMIADSKRKIHELWEEAKDN